MTGIAEFFAEKPGEDFADALLKKVRGTLAENTLVDAAGTIEEKINRFNSRPLDHSMIREASEYLRPLLSELEHCSSSKHNKTAQDIKRKAAELLNIVINRINSEFNKIYKMMDCVFFLNKPDAETKTTAYRDVLGNVVKQYQELIAGIGAAGSALVSREIDKKLAKYSAVLIELEPIKNELNLLLNNYSKNAFRSKAELIQTKDKVSGVKKESEHAIKKHKPRQILQYHTPFDFKEHISLAEEFLSELESLSKGGSLSRGNGRDYEVVNKYKHDMLLHVSSISKELSNLESIIATQNYTNFNCQEIAAALHCDYSDKTNFEFEKKYPLFLGSVHKMLREAHQLVESKKSLLKGRITKYLIEEFNILYASCEQAGKQESKNQNLKKQSSPGLDVGGSDKESEKYEKYISNLGSQAAAMKILNETFIAVGNTVYSKKCSASICELEKNIFELAEAKKTYEKIANGIKQMKDSIKSIKQLEAENSRTKQPAAKQTGLTQAADNVTPCNEQQLVTLRNALSKKHNPEAYSAFTNNKHLHNAIDSYSAVAREYKTLVDSLAHSTIFSIDDSVKEIKGEQAAKIERAIDQLEILDDSKSIPQKVGEKIAELKEIKEEMTDCYAAGTHPLAAEYSKNRNKLLLSLIQQQAQPSLELSDYFSVAQEPADKGIKEMIRTLRGFTGELSWNDTFKSAAEAVRELVPSTNVHDISYLKGLAFALSSSMHNGSIRTGVKYNGLSERLVIRLINCIQNYVDSSELKRAAVFS